MFLNNTIKVNKNLIDCALEFHKLGLINPDSYIIDLDSLISNAKNIFNEANKHNIDLFFMLKQVGRNPYIAKKLIEVGYKGAVVVDYKEALVMIDNNVQIANVGHLVQIPKNLLKKIIMAKPLYITVYSIEILNEINSICIELDIVQKIILKVIDLKNDIIYEGQYGGFVYEKLNEIVEFSRLNKNVNICGLTSFPCVLYDESVNEFKETKNVNTIYKAKKYLTEHGIIISELNMPSATCVESMGLLSKLGATQAEPGHGLSASTPYHAKNITIEKLCMIYLSEISHSLSNKSYCYAGGYYRRGFMKEALIESKIYNVSSPNVNSIDYYFEIEGVFKYSTPVIMNFRTQIFVTRSNVVLIKGISENKPQLVGEYDAQGKIIQEGCITSS